MYAFDYQFTVIRVMVTATIELSISQCQFGAIRLVFMDQLKRLIKLIISECFL